jgi:hypothetical protein
VQGTLDSGTGAEVVDAARARRAGLTALFFGGRMYSSTDFSSLDRYAQQSASARPNSAVFSDLPWCERDTVADTADARVARCLGLPRRLLA